TALGDHTAALPAAHDFREYWDTSVTSMPCTPRPRKLDAAEPEPSASSWGDDIVYGNSSAQNCGRMGDRTPISTAWPMKARSLQTNCGERSCSGPARHASPGGALWSGLLKAELPSVKGASAHDEAIAELLEPHGLGDRTIRQEPHRRWQRVPA